MKYRQLVVKPLSKQNLPDFFSLHCEKNGEGWCNCVAWHVPTWDGWDKRTKDQNLEMRNQLFDSDQYDGYILYADSEPVAWCQCGPRDRLKKLISSYKLDPSNETWAVTCFIVPPQYRNNGYALALLNGVVDNLNDKGVTHLQGFPKRGRSLEAGEVWTGPEALFIKAGFQCEREHEKIPIYGLRMGGRNE